MHPFASFLKEALEAESCIRKVPGYFVVIGVLLIGNL